ncbi:MAG TPA: hypothetical protein VFA50_05370 [Stellaceae bacterium]|nr:hypothetical protein [Stellaceae bacterium]
MHRNIAAIVGQNENGILAYQSQAFMDLLRPFGFVGHVVDLARPGWQEVLNQAVQGGLVFAWGYAGIGSGIKVGDRNLWDALDVGYVAVHADTPCAMPSNHFVKARRVANGYVFRDWLGMHRRFLRSPQITGMLPMGVIPNRWRDKVPWAKREHRMVFLKTGADPEARRAKWAGWGTRLQAALEDAAAQLCRRGTGDITATALASLEANGLFIEERKDLLFGLLLELDQYVRAVRATTMARALRDIPALIIGAGWEHVSAEAGRARFLPAAPADGIDELYANCQWLVNTTPNFSSGTHERVLRGFAAKSCVVSDDNDFTRERLHGLPSYRGVEWHAPDLAERLAAIYHDPSPFDDVLLQPALSYVEREHDPLAFMKAVMELAEVTCLKGLDQFLPEPAA